MEKIFKIRVEESTFREIWRKEWDELEGQLGCSDNPHSKDSLKNKFPNLFKLLIGTLNQFRYIGSLEGRLEDKEQELQDWYAENGILDDARPDFDNDDEVARELIREIECIKQELEDLSK